MSRRRNPVAKNLKDYLVPIIGGILILFILISIFSGGDSTPEIQNENKIGINVEMDTSNTESFVIYPGQDRVEILDSISLFKGEELIVREGSLRLSIPQLGEARLGKLGELKFNEDTSFTHSSGKLWINSQGNIDVQSRFATVKISSNTTISIDQNEMATTIYGLSGTIEVINLAGENTILLPGEKITISRLDANSEDVEMKNLREPIDDIFKNDDWYIINNGDRYLNNTNQEDEDSEVESKLVSNGSRVLVFDMIEDEGIMSEGSIDITGKFGNGEITKISLNNSIEAKVNITEKTFVFEDVDISSTQNDLVFRAMNIEGDILEKRLVTLYYNGATNNSSRSSQFGEAKNYTNIDASQFTFTAPSNFTTYSTTSPEVTIQGRVLNKDVAFVRINGFQLGSYNTVSGTWKYHAFTRFNNIKNGTNVYEIKYYDKDNKLMFTNNYTIVKRIENGIISNEANITG